MTPVDMRIILLSVFIHHGVCKADANTHPKKHATAFGKILGINHHVAGFSNSNNSYHSHLWHSIQINKKPIKTGMKWQCVEYARRWLILEKAYTFASVNHAYQIWNLLEAKHVITHKTTPWEKFANGKTNTRPHKGDLLIFDTTQGEHGHVSVIVAVNHKYVFLAEQNDTNLPWEGKSYARKLKLIHDKNKVYSIQDSGIIGWMRIH